MSGAMGGIKGGIGSIAGQVLAWLQNLPQHLRSLKMDWLKNMFSGLQEKRPLHMADSVVGPLQNFFKPVAPAEAAARIAPMMTEFASAGIPVGKDRADLTKTEGREKAYRVTPEAQNAAANEELAGTQTIYGRPVQQHFKEMRERAAMPGLRNKAMNFPSVVANFFGEKTGDPMIARGAKDQLARFIGVGPGKGGDLVINAGAPQAVEAMQTQKVYRMEAVRRLTQIALASAAVGAGVGMVDAWRKKKKAKDLEKDLTAGIPKMARDGMFAKAYGDLKSGLNDTFSGLSNGGLLSSLPMGAIVPAAAGVAVLASKAGYKPVDALTDSARERWLRERKLKARKQFHDALLGLSKEGAALDAMAEDIVGEMEKSAMDPQDAASGLTGGGLALLSILAGGGAVAGKAIADARDKGRKRYAELEREIRSRALPSRLSVAMSAAPADPSHMLSAQEVVIPEVLSSKKKKDVGGEMKLADNWFSKLDDKATNWWNDGKAPSGGLMGGLRSAGKDLVTGAINDSVPGGLDAIKKYTTPEGQKEIGANIMSGAMGGIKGGIGSIAGQVLAWLQNLPQHLKEMKMTWLKNLFGGLQEKRPLPALPRGGPAHGLWNSGGIPAAPGPYAPPGAPAGAPPASPVAPKAPVVPPVQAPPTPPAPPAATPAPLAQPAATPPPVPQIPQIKPKP